MRNTGSCFAPVAVSSSRVSLKRKERIDNCVVKFRCELLISRLRFGERSGSGSRLQRAQWELSWSSGSDPQVRHSSRMNPIHHHCDSVRLLSAP